MTVIQPNAVSGINSITVQTGNSLSIHKADGSLIRTITGVTGITTFATVSVGSATTDFAQGGGINIGLGASISNGSGNVLTFGTNGDDRVTIDATGKIGVNNTSPSYTMDLLGDQIRLKSNASASNAVLRLWGQDTNTGGAIIAQNSAGNAAPLLFYNSNTNEAMRISSAGKVGINTNSPSSWLNIHQGDSGTVDAIIVTNSSTTNNGLTLGVSSVEDAFFWNGSNTNMTFATNNTERLRIAADGKLLVGKNSAYGSAIAQVHNTSQYVLDLNIWAASADPAVLAFYKSRNATPGGATIVQDDDGIGSLRFLGNDGANSREAAYIKAFVDGTPGTDDMPGRIVFGTTADGASNSTERLRIDSSGRLLVGHTASEAMFFTGSIQVQGTSSSTSAITVKTNQNDSGGPAIILGKSRGAKGSATVVQSGDELGAIHFAGADGTDTNSRAAAIRCNVDGSPGSNDMPGRLMFLTTADGASTETERLRIDSSGNITVGDATYGSSLGQLRIINNAASTPASLALFGYGNTTTNTSFAKIQFASQESSTGGQVTAEIGALAQGTDERAANLVFKTRPDTSGSATIERLRISSTGDIKFTGDDYNMTWRYSASALRLDDNGQINFGTDDDGDIYHDGAQMIINNATGTLKVRSDNLQLTHANNTVHVNCVSGGAVSLYHNGTSKLATASSGVTVSGSIDDSKGDVRAIPKEAKTSSYTLVAADAGKCISTNSGVTIPDAVFSAGDAVTIWNDSSSAITITQGSGFQLRKAGETSTGNVSLANFGLATLWWNTGGTAVITGNFA